MSKRNRQFNRSAHSTPTLAPSQDLVAEYRIIKHDLIRVLIINLVFLAGMLALYFTDQRYGYLEKWFSNILHF